MEEEKEEVQKGELGGDGVWKEEEEEENIKREKYEEGI